MKEYLINRIKDLEQSFRISAGKSMDICLPFYERKVYKGLCIEITARRKELEAVLVFLNSIPD